MLTAMGRAPRIRTTSRLTLRARLTVALTLAGLLIFGGFSLSQLEVEERQLRSSVQRETELLARSVQTAAENALRDGQRADVVETFDRIDALAPGVHLIVLDVDGGTVARSPADEPPDEFDLELAIKVLESRRPASLFIGADRLDRLVVAMPLAHDDMRPLGSLVLSRPLGELREDLSSTRNSQLILVVLFVLVHGMLCSLLVRFYLRPVNDLVRSMRAVRRGDLSARLRVARGDEIGLLVAEFNSTLEALSSTRNELISETEARLRMERGLLEVDKMITIGQLAAGLAHEIGSPLQVLSGRAGALLSRRHDPDEVHRNAQILVEQTDRIVRIVDQLLSFGRQPAAHRGPVDLAVPVGKVLELIESDARRGGVDLTLEVVADRRTVIAHPDQLQQLTLNLVRNALAATSAGGQVKVRIEPAEQAGERETRSAVVLAVADSGAGIPPELQARLFEPFFTTRAGQGGTGLGLAVVRSIARDLGGEVTLSSSPGDGATFEVMLPLGGGEGPEADHG
jgi:signal transduction histidine kinase